MVEGVPNAASFTSGMLTGAIQGSYYFGLSNLKQLESQQRRQGLPGARPMTDGSSVCDGGG